MINKLLPHAAHLLVALKKTIPAVLLLGTLSLVSAPTARAQILFSVDAFTTDLLTITLLPSTLLTGIEALRPSSMFLGVDPSADWITGATSATVVGGSWGSAIFTSATTDVEGDAVVLQWVGGLDGVNASGLTSSMTCSFAGTGAFQPAVVDRLTLSWGMPGEMHTIQSFVSGPWGVGAVPEPSTFTALTGLAALGLAGTRRRRTAEANA
jgi:hypothetical protein